MFNRIIEFKVTAINNFSTWINNKNKKKTGLEIEELKGKKGRKKEMQEIQKYRTVLSITIKFIKFHLYGLLNFIYSDLKNFTWFPNTIFKSCVLSVSNYLLLLSKSAGVRRFQFLFLTNFSNKSHSCELLNVLLEY